jgi:hypothetical protein
MQEMSYQDLLIVLNRPFNLPAQFSTSKDALLTAASAKLRVDTLRLKRLVEFWRGLWPPK